MPASGLTRLFCCLALLLASGCAQLGRPDSSELAPTPQAAYQQPLESKAKSISKWGAPRPNELEIARHEEQAGHLPEAESLYRSVARKNPRSPVAFHRLGVLAAQQGRLEDAQLHFETAREMAPATVELLNDIAYTYALQQELGEAERYYRRALILNPQQPLLCANLGTLLVRQGRFKEGLAIFRRATTPKDAYLQLAAASEMAGNLPAARQWAQAAVELEPEAQSAVQALIDPGDKAPAAMGDTAIQLAGHEFSSNQAAEPAAAGSGNPTGEEVHALYVAGPNWTGDASDSAVLHAVP